MSPILEEAAQLVVDHMGLLKGIDSAPGRRLLAALDYGSTWVKHRPRQSQPLDIGTALICDWRSGDL